MAELVDALVSGTSSRKGVQVRFLFWAPQKSPVSQHDAGLFYWGMINRRIVICWPTGCAAGMDAALAKLTPRRDSGIPILPSISIVNVGQASRQTLPELVLLVKHLIHSVK